MPTVQIPSLMRDLSGGKAQVDVPGRTIRHVIEALDRIYPGVKARLCEDGRLNPGLAVSVDGHISRLGLAHPVDVDSEIRFLPAVSGG